jgi:hypothetical protein
VALGLAIPSLDCRSTPVDPIVNQVLLQSRAGLSKPTIRPYLSAMINTLFTKAGLPAMFLAALALFSAGPVHAGEFHYDDSTRSIQMKGTILAGDGQKFSALLRSHPETETVELLSSVGGEYNSSLQMSLEVKSRGLHTVSSNYCHSGCAYIWLAGATRSVVGSANPEIHLPYANATHEAYPKLTYAWLERLGLSSAFADAVVEAVGPDNNFVKLTPGFLTKFGAAG